METACLKIKFTPLIKNIHMNDSKCCLEIVPEVSCLKNFDKIEWKQDQKFYEYVIPMTYKIILKRRDNQGKDTDYCIDNLSPVYHSCVDLLHPSVTSTCLGSGDINRIVSDNFILHKVTTDIKNNITILQCNETRNVKNIKTKVTASKQTVEASGLTAVDCKNNKGFEVTEKKNLIEQSHRRAVVKFAGKPTKSLQKIIDTVTQLVENGCLQTNPARCNSGHNLSTEITNQEQSSERNGTGSMRKLSLTPICSINTNDDATTTIPSIDHLNFMKSPDYQAEKDIVFYGNMPTIEEKVFHFFSPSIKIDTITPKYLAPTKRLTPEERICNFLKLMQKEIFPLKFMLNDIIKKYTALNINQNVVDKTVSSKKQKSDVNKIEGQKQIKVPLKQVRSNRVVYSIVFDG